MADVTFDDLVALLASLADVPSEGGGCSELDHGLQCAAELARVAPDDVELQVAGLVHDIGHAFGDDASHGLVGGALVRPLLGERVARLVEGHVPAKRYLVAVEPEHALSAESIVTLGHQGGPFDEAGLEAFRARPDWEAAVVLRRADDAAKVPGRVVPDLDAWLPTIREVAT